MAVPLAAPPAAAEGPRVSVLADFGDGTYLWANVTLPAGNVTALKATELANATWGLPPMNVTWFDASFCLRRPCALVNDLGDREPSGPVYWHFYLWDAAARQWGLASYGPSDTDLSDGEVIAWYLAVDDPATFASPRPVPTPLAPDAWTSFRGDLSNTGRAHGAIPVTNRVLWDHNVSVLEIDTTPVVAYGRVFVATRDALVAIDAATGAEVWRNPQVHDLLSTPAVYYGRLVLGGTDGRLHVVNATDGREAWSVLLEPGARSTGIASSPAVYMGRAYVGTFNETAGGKGRVVAVNLNNGTIAWSYDAPGVVHMSSPAIHDGNLYVGIMGTYDGGVGYAAPYGLLSLRLDGAENWFLPTNASVAGSPIVAAGRVVFTTRSGWLIAAGTDGVPVWSRDLGGLSTGGPTVVGGIVYAAVNGGLGAGVAPFALDTGEPMGSAFVPILAGAVLQASLVSDDRLVCSASNVAVGSHLCFTRSGAVAWSHTADPPGYVLGSEAVAGDTMYAPSDNGHVYAFRDDPAHVALARIGDVGFDPPLSTGGAGGSEITFPVEALGRGPVVNATVHVQVGPGLQLPGESLDDASRPREVRLPVGNLTSDGTAQVGIHATWVTPSRPWFLNWSLTYEDLAGRAYSTGWTRASEGPSPPAIDVWVLAAAVAVPWVLVAVFLLVRRWRLRRGP